MTGKIIRMDYDQKLARIRWSETNGFLDLKNWLPWDEIDPYCQKEYTRDYVESPNTR